MLQLTRSARKPSFAGRTHVARADSASIFVCWLGFAVVNFVGASGAASAAEPNADELKRSFAPVRHFLKSYCCECHGQDLQEAKLDLSVYLTQADVASAHQMWEIVLTRLEAGEMPPAESQRQPEPAQRRAVVDWIRAFRRSQALRNAGDPGPVLVHRLSNAEYNYSIRDLTGVDIRPTESFPVDPANEAGFDNSGESLAMSPALLKKYLDAARQVVEHLVLKPAGFSFAPHPVVTDTDRDKYCVKRVVRFYQSQPTDYGDYFLAAWQFETQTAGADSKASLADFAASNQVSSKYLSKIWSTLVQVKEEVGPIATLQAMWQQLPNNATQLEAARAGCRKMRDYVVQLRKELEPKFENLLIEGSHRGSQPFVLWKNRQYAAHRRTYDRGALRVQDDAKLEEQLPPELTVPADESERARYEAAFERFCGIFPDAFFVSERGRDYLDKPLKNQEQGRLLSAGFHSMMGYFRDDGPLYEMILDPVQQRELDLLWQELDFITSAPLRQYAGFLWFERTDSRFMRDPVFDFARAEDKDATSEQMIQKLSEVYLDKARNNGGGSSEIRAIESYFREINSQIRWVERARIEAQTSHLDALLEFAARAYRRNLLATEREDLLAFYRARRLADGLGHEEAIQDTIVSVLMSPFFCYRLDLAGAGEGRRPLTDYELASRLSYFMWSTIPDQALLESAAAGDLRRREGLLSQTQRMLGDERVRGLATEFGGNWLDFRRFEEHNSVDRQRFPSFTDDLRRAMFEEPIRFFVDLVQQDRSVLDFLYADYTFVNRVLADHYGMRDRYTRNTSADGRPISSSSSGRPVGSGAPTYQRNSSQDPWIRIANAADYKRGGLLPMSVFLTKNAPGLRTSPVKRGYWVVRRLLGERIPAPPPNVPELPDDETKLGELTLPAMLARHRADKSCAACHKRFDSFGLVFENYGPIGELRDEDLSGRPVRTAATFPDASEADGLAGLLDYLRERRQDEFLENLCRKLLTYALGRTLQLSDDPLVEELRAKLAADGYRFSVLVEGIVSSPQFLQKRGRDQLFQERSSNLKDGCP